MAYTTSGLEFHLLQALPVGDGEDAAHVVESHIRGTDGMFLHSGDIFIAVQGNVPAAGRAARRMMRALRDKGVEASVRLVEEPFPASLGDVAYRFINGEVPVAPRSETNPFANESGARRL